MRLTPRQLFALFLVSIAFAFATVGCRLARNDSEQQRQQREAAFQEVRQRVSPSLLLGTIVYVGLAFFAPAIAEKAREAVAQKLSLGPGAQVKLALFIYWLAVGTIFVLALINIHLRQVRPSVFLLLGATAYPFFVHLIPSLKEGDRIKRKSAITQIKSFLMLIFVFYVVMRLLTPEGLGLDPCMRCLGKGQISCLQCKGAGKTGWFKPVICRACGGNAKVLCSECKGTGQRSASASKAH